MWVLFLAIFVIGLLAIIANFINGAVEIIKVCAVPLLIIGAILLILACIFC